MAQNAVSTRVRALLSQNEAFVKKPVQFEYLEPSAFYLDANSKAKHRSNVEETIHRWVLTFTKSKSRLIKNVSKRLLLISNA